MKKYLMKVWHDPVGASVIAGVIVILLTSLCATIWSWFGEDSFWGTLRKIANADVKSWVVIVIALAYFIIRKLAYEEKQTATASETKSQPEQKCFLGFD
jgi:L-asparagine transporter-like permease